VAVQAGTINELRYRSLGGNSFHLANDAGDYFYYAHLLRYAAGIQEGSYVEAGQVLGYVGNTGNAITTPPHLHFEIHPGGGAPIDPFPYLELWRAGDISAAADSGDAGGLPASSPSPGSPVNSLDAERGRHEEGVLLPHLPAPSTRAGMSAIALIPAAISFGALGGLMTTAARRHRDFLLVSMDAQDLCRAARAG
jgi:hypothetical protein